MNANEIEVLAQKFGQALKDITPDAIALAQQMFLISAIKEGIATVILSICLWVALNKGRKVVRETDAYDRDFVGMFVSVGIGIVSIIWIICLMSFVSNVVNVFYPEAALLGKFLK